MRERVLHSALDKTTDKRTRLLLLRRMLFFPQYPFGMARKHLFLQTQNSYDQRTNGEDDHKQFVVAQSYQLLFSKTKARARLSVARSKALVYSVPLRHLQNEIADKP